MSSSHPHYDRYRLLLELNNAMVSNLELRDLFFAVCEKPCSLDDLVDAVNEAIASASGDPPPAR